MGYNAFVSTEVLLHGQSITTAIGATTISDLAIIIIIIIIVTTAIMLLNCRTDNSA